MAPSSLSLDLFSVFIESHAFLGNDSSPYDMLELVTGPAESTVSTNSSLGNDDDIQLPVHRENTTPGEEWSIQAENMITYQELSTTTRDQSLDSTSNVDHYQNEWSKLCHDHPLYMVKFTLHGAPVTADTIVLLDDINIIRAYCESLGQDMGAPGLPDATTMRSGILEALYAQDWFSRRHVTVVKVTQPPVEYSSETEARGPATHIPQQHFKIPASVPRASKADPMCKQSTTRVLPPLSLAPKSIRAAVSPTLSLDTKSWPVSTELGSAMEDIDLLHDGPPVTDDVFMDNDNTEDMHLSTEISDFVDYEGTPQMNIEDPLEDSHFGPGQEIGSHTCENLDAPAATLSHDDDFDAIYAPHLPAIRDCPETLPSLDDFQDLFHGYTPSPERTTEPDSVPLPLPGHSQHRATLSRKRNRSASEHTNPRAQAPPRVNLSMTFTDRLLSTPTPVTSEPRNPAKVKPMRQDKEQQRYGVGQSSTYRAPAPIPREGVHTFNNISGNSSSISHIAPSTSTSEEKKAQRAKVYAFGKRRPN
jgi:hypothetical protein